MIKEAKKKESTSEENEDTESVWPKFRAWLREEAGVQPSTARTYATQAKRIVSDLHEDLSQETLNAWVGQMSAQARTPFRASWRKYQQFMEATYKVTLPGFSTLVADLPEDVTAALRLLKAQPLGVNQMAALTTTRQGGALFQALCAVNPEVAAGKVLAILTANGETALVPKAAFRVLLAWGKQGDRSDGAENPRWLIPACPGACKAMLPLTISRLVRQPAHTEPPQQNR